MTTPTKQLVSGHLHPITGEPMHQEQNTTAPTRRKIGEQAYRDEHRKALAEGASGEVAHERAIAAQIAARDES
jgi:hypothetical protein